MVDLTPLLIFGPGLMTAAVAVVLFAAWRSLSRRRHVICWATGFSALATAILIRGFWPQRDGPAGMLVAFAVQALGLATTALLAAGFASRSAHPLRIGVPLAAAVAVAGMLHLGGAPRAAPAAVTAFVQAGFLLAAISSLARKRPRLVLAERLVLVALAAEILLRLLAGITLAFGIVLPLAASGGHGWPPALMIEPACLGLLAMFLIASDLSAELNRLVWTDPLTGVLNRAGFEDAAALVLKRVRRSDRPVSLAIADIDHFKAINDTHGHAVGDTTLREFAKTLADALRPDELIGRIGGEEFALLLPAHDGRAALARVEPIRALAARMPSGHARQIRLTACFGVAERAPGETLPDLLARADHALYRCKADGRDRCALAALPVSA